MTDGTTSLRNEPDFATPYEYNYINKQYKSVNQSRSLANQLFVTIAHSSPTLQIADSFSSFHNANYGVPGNSDAGALNSWLIWQMLGLYPVATQDVYLIESPWFSDINMTVNNDKLLRITASNLDNENRYSVQSVKLNGKDWNRNWFQHKDIMVDGGTIEFELGSEMKQWETGDVPPSPGHIIL